MNQLYAQINVKPDTPAEDVADVLTDLLTKGLYKHLEEHPELIQRKRDPVSGMDVYSAKLIFVRHHIDPSDRGKRICSNAPDVHPEDAWAEEARNLDCPLCGGSGNVDDVRRCKHCNTPMQPGVAIEQTYTGTPDFAGGEIVTLSPGGPGKLIDCLKCPQCGWSVSTEESCS